MGVAITQDPAYMGNQVPKNDNRRSLRDVNETNMEAQQRIENKFHKPTMINNENMSKLYFR